MAGPKLASKLPPGEANGIGPILRDLIDGDGMHVVIAVVDCQTVTLDKDTGARVPTIRVRRIEAVTRDDMPEAERLVRRALQARSGKTVLPLEVEDEIAEVFRLVDPATGEKLTRD